jgi:hypothetical protein
VQLPAELLLGAAKRSQAAGPASEDAVMEDVEAPPVVKVFLWCSNVRYRIILVGTVLRAVVLGRVMGEKSCVPDP